MNPWILLIALLAPALARLPRISSRRVTPTALLDTPSGSGLLDQLETNIETSSDLDEKEDVFDHAFESLLTEEDAEKFSSHLKLWASKRAPLTRGEKQSLIEASLTRMHTLDADRLSSSIWSLGVIGYKLNPSTLQVSNSEGKKVNRKMIGRSSRHHLTLSHTLSHSLIQHSIRALEEVGLHTEVLCRVLNSLARMGCDWSSLPEEIKAAVVDVLTEERQEVALRGNELSCGNGKNISILCYTLGQLQTKASDLPPQAVEGMLTRLNDAFQSRAMTPQGIVNSLNGLHRLGLQWTDHLGVLLPPLCTNVLEASTEAVGSMRKDEVCSLLHSFASLRVSWADTLPYALQAGIVQSLGAHAASFSNREIANAYWALGKVNYPYSVKIRKGESDPEKAHMEGALSESLARSAATFNQFDVESTFVGLGLMEVPFESLPQQAQYDLLQRVEAQLEGMNIFKLHNVLWGMARVGLTIDSPEFSEHISALLLEKTVSVFHTFMKRQYGDVMWALGSIGYSFNGQEGRSQQSCVSSASKTRILAILTRVFTNLETREAAYVLWGLAKMGARWHEDMCEETHSHVGGEVVSPMARTVSLYLKRQQFREHDYAVLLYSLGALGVKFHENLSPGIVSKLNKVAPYVSPHFSSRSLCNCLDGLAACGTVWADVSGGDVVKEAYITAMQARSVEARGNGSDKKGIIGMNALEITKTLSSLAVMGVRWEDDLPQGVQSAVEEVLERESDHFTAHNMGVVNESLEKLRASSLRTQDRL